MSKKRPLENNDDENTSDEYSMTTKLRKTETQTIDDGNTSEDKPKFPKILDGTYYKITEYDKKSDYVGATCTNCTKKKTIIRGKRTSTGNFHTHYARLHSDKSEDVKSYCDENRDAKQKAERTSKTQSILPFAHSLDPTKVIRFRVTHAHKYLLSVVITRFSSVLSYTTESEIKIELNANALLWMPTTETKKRPGDFLRLKKLRCSFCTTFGFVCHSNATALNSI